MKKLLITLVLLVSLFFCNAQVKDSIPIVKLTDQSYLNIIFKIMNKIVTRFPNGMTLHDIITIDRDHLGDEKEYIRLMVNGLLVDAYFIK